MRYHQTDWGNIDIVGPVMTAPAETDEQGEVTIPAQYDNRFHVNARGEVPEEWEPYRVSPSPAMRKFQLGDTQYFRWESEAEAQPFLAPYIDEESVEDS